jgi:DNA mismatch repair protein MutS
MSVSPPLPLEKLSPMLRQYVETKMERPDVILLMRVGDFFEAYGEDASLISEQLGITLTGRDIAGLTERYPMAGVPFHALERYLTQLVRKGFKVAICDQVEDPKFAKGLVKRRVTRVVTPGTLIEDSLLDAKSNNYLVAALLGEPVCGLGVVDVSTGEFLVTEIPAEGGIGAIIAEIQRLSPAECLVPEGLDELAEQIRAQCPTTLTLLERKDIPRTARASLLDHFGVTTLRGFGCDEYTVGLDAAATLLHYVKNTHMSAASHIQTLGIYTIDDAMVLDPPTRRNLELTSGSFDNSKNKSLLAVMDATQTSMGGRLLKKWLDSPLLSVDRIERRLDAIEAFFDDSLSRGDVRDALRQIADLERLTARISTATANARDLVALRLSLEAVPQVAHLAGQIDHAIIKTLCENLDGLVEISGLVATAITDEPPVSLREGNLIKDGFDPDLDELRHISRDGKGWIATLEADERERTGIKSLKVGYTSVFGYYIEITKANAANVPENYIRKQTTTAGERYITPELKEMEAKVLGAEDKITSREYDLFVIVRDEIAAQSAKILTVAQAVAKLDVVAALAEVAQNNRFVRPIVDNETIIEIKGGRHPVVEKLMASSVNFIPNDTYLDTTESKLHVITGPNSAGKSTVLRQVALITLLAQVGSFVPADHARIGIVDRIFTRVGAHDDLAAGQSTFMVEMTETANILNNVTERSLVILDEIGRGTSTFDGVSIAWAVAEFLAERNCKTLFATHYHLLNELEKQIPGVQNYRIAVKEMGDRIVWLRKVLPGGTDKSYGVQVARMAGLPPTVITRAGEILVDLEKQGKTQKEMKEIVTTKTQKLQMTLFEAEPDPIIEEIKAVDLATLSPIEALNLLYKWQKDAK